MKSNVNRSENVWKDICDYHYKLENSLVEFLSSDIDRVQIIRSALSQGVTSPVLYVAQFMSEDELILLFPELLDLVSHYHRYIGEARKIIKQISQEWLVANIESAAEPILLYGTEDEYRRLLEIYSDLDGDMAIRLAERAKMHSDRDIQEAGDDFLRKTKSKE